MQMAVAMDDGVVVPLRKCLRMIVVAMGEEESPSGIDKDGVIGHHVKGKQHLIDFCIAISAHGDDAVCPTVEQLHHALAVHARRQAVAWPIVEDVAQEQEGIEVLGIVESENLLQGAGGSVEVGGDKIAHDTMRVGGIYSWKISFSIWQLWSLP